MKEYHVVISFGFNIDATSEKAAREIVHTQALNEWIPNIVMLKDSQIEITQIP